MRFLQNLWVTMSDGVRLALDVYLPESDAPAPVVLYFGPYRKDDYITHFGNLIGLGERYTERGMALAVADVRGTNNSEGVTRFMFNLREQQDGAEVVEWIAAQPWCDGNVGMTGTSYGYFTSLLVAAQQPPHLRTVVPINGAVTWFYCLNEGGLPQVFGYHANYMAIMIAMQGAPPGYRDPDGCWRERWRRRLEEYVPWGLEWLGAQAEDEYWDPAAVARVYGRIRIPVFVIGGWWDRYATDPFKLYEAIAGPAKILMGPWLHSRLDLSAPGPRVDYEIVLRWFEYWLMRKDNGIPHEPPITVYSQEYAPPAGYRSIIPGQWRHYSKWPAPGTIYRRRYLHSGNALSLKAPEREGRIEYPYDPRVGISSGLSGGIYGPVGMPLDQRLDEAASAVFTSERLNEPVEITGIPKVRIYFSSTARRMGVIAKLCDVAPDGTVALVTRGYLNVAHRHGTAHPVLLSAGRTYALDFEMKATAYTFARGHAIRLLITSAEFPTALATPESGANTIHFGPDEPSYVELPVVPASNSAGDAPSLCVLPPPPDEPPSNRQYEVSRDSETGAQTAVLHATNRFRGPEGWIEHDHHTWATVYPDALEQESLKGEALFRFEYDSGECVESASTVTISGQSDIIRTEAELRVTVDGAEHFVRRWSASHERKFI